MNDELKESLDLDSIVDNLGIGYILKKRFGYINKVKKNKEYYEVICADLGFCLEDNIFVSLIHDSGMLYSMGYDSEDDFVIDFKLISDFVFGKKKGKFSDILNKYQDKLGKFYVYNNSSDDFQEITDKAFLSKVEKDKKGFDFDIVKINDEIKKVIISQDEQIKQILASIYKNQKIIKSSLDDEMISKLKENIIIYGPTGCGKTEILSQVAKLCNVPIVIEDATSFTESGYVGRDVSDMLLDLYMKANRDLVQAENGILVIDEFDKLAEGAVSDGASGPSRYGVQRSLLKLLDGGSITISEDDYNGHVFEFNTSRLTVVALGAFSGIKKDDDYTDVSMKDFIDMGIIREVMGRFSKLVAMNHFSSNDYKKILLESNLSPLNTYKKMFEEMGIAFSYDDELINYIVLEAQALNCGARGLKTVCDGIISDELFGVFSGDKKNIHLKVPTDKNKSYVYKKKVSENRKKVGFH